MTAEICMVGAHRAPLQNVLTFVTFFNVVTLFHVVCED
jgi:hypothetical protein